MNFRQNKQTHRGERFGRGGTGGERGRDKAGVWFPCLSCLTLCCRCHRTGGLPCVLCRLLFLPARRGQRAGDFGGTGWGGDGHPPRLPSAACGPFHLDPTSGDGGWGREGCPPLGWRERGVGSGLWGGLEFSPERPNKEMPPNPQSVSPTPTLPGVTRLVLPAAPHDLSLFIQHFHVLRSSSELSPPLKGS